MTAATLPIRTARLALRAHREGDAVRLHEVYAQPDVARFLLDEPWTREVAIEKLADRIPKCDLDSESGAVALVVELNGGLVGDVLLWYTDEARRCAEIGWVFDPAFGGQGYASEAVAAVLNLAFDEYGIHRVAAQMDARNEASAKLAERVGMLRESHAREDWWSKGEWTDTLTYGMLGQDRTESATSVRGLRAEPDPRAQ